MISNIEIVLKRTSWSKSAYHWEQTLNFVPYSEVSLILRLLYISDRCGKDNRAVEHSVATFSNSELSLANIMSINEYPLKQGH